MVPQPPAALSVYCVYLTNTSMVLVCRTMEKGGNTVCLEGEALSFFRARLKEVGSELALFHGTVVESSVNSEIRKMG